VQEAAQDLVLQSEDGEKAGGEASGQLDLIPEMQFKKLSDFETDYRIVDDAPGLQALVETLKAAGRFAFDTETTALNPRSAELVGISFAVRAHEGYWVPFSAHALDALRPVFADPELGQIGHNLKFDLAVLAEQDCPVAGPCYDTMLAHALIHPEQRHSLDVLAEDILHYTTIRFGELFPDLKKGASIDFSSVEPKALANYAIEDADVALQLWEVFEPQLAESGQAGVFYDIETPLLPVLTAMEREGIRLSREKLHDIGLGLQDHIIGLQESIYEAAGREFNLNSPKQLGEVLFEELRLVEKPKKTRTGQYATNEQVLATLAPKHPIVANLLEYRQITKLKSTYIDALPNSVDAATGRVHTHYGQVQTATGRLSSNDPNLQNIPVRSDRGREIRRAFVPREGWLLLAADYSQIELRILAALSGDAGLLEAFQNGDDIHTATAARIFEVAPDAVSRDQRSTAKMVNFGIPYGISAFGLAQRLGGVVSRGEAQAIIDSYFAQFPGIPGYIEKQVEGARKNGYVATVCGRRRYLRDINSSNGTIRAAAERNAINMPIQGTAADMIKLAMIRTHRRIAAEGLRSRLLLQVHDELVFDCHPEEEEALRELVTESMVGALALDCPVEIEIGSGQNWLEAH
jgi:DNA polymerase-1